MDHNKFIAKPGKKIRLKDFDPAYTGSYKNKEQAAGKLEEDVLKLGEQQDILYAQDSHAVLIIIQAMDAAGKDSTVKHVMSGINPQGCVVNSFKEPSNEELGHDFLWRASRALPQRGYIGIFNRSYYEEVLVVKVHPEILQRQKIPKELITPSIWKERYDDINAFERHLVRNGTTVLKFFLHVSKEEQRKRFLARLDEQEKNWKFSTHDVQERQHWAEYMRAYEEAISVTSTEEAPWYIIPADHKWFTRVAVADIIRKSLTRLDLSYPVVGSGEKASLNAARNVLLEEKKD